MKYLTRPPPGFPNFHCRPPRQHDRLQVHRARQRGQHTRKGVLPRRRSSAADIRMAVLRGEHQQLDRSRQQRFAVDGPTKAIGRYHGRKRRRQRRRQRRQQQPTIGHVLRRQPSERRLLRLRRSQRTRHRHRLHLPQRYV